MPRRRRQPTPPDTADAATSTPVDNSHSTQPQANEDTTCNYSSTKTPRRSSRRIIKKNKESSNNHEENKPLHEENQQSHRLLLMERPFQHVDIDALHTALDKSNHKQRQTNDIAAAAADAQWKICCSEDATALHLNHHYKNNNKNSLSLALYSNSNSNSNSNRLPSKLQSRCMQLFTRNMKSMYEASSWGFDSKEKDAELCNDAAHFLVLLDTTCTTDVLLAFSHFRLEHDEAQGTFTLYVWEIQVDVKCQGQGFGRLLMAVLEQIAVQCVVCSVRSEREHVHVVVDKIALTVFRHNEAARGFYGKLGFGLDEDSPLEEEEEEEDYVILSKRLRRLRRTARRGSR